MGIPVDSSPTFPSNCTTLSTALPSPASNPSSPSRCEGLDLLAMAALQVAGVAEEEEGSNGNEVRNSGKPVMVVKSQGGIGGVGFGSTLKRSRRQTLMPSKYQDSVLQPWKRGSKQRRPPAAARQLG